MKEVAMGVHIQCRFCKDMSQNILNTDFYLCESCHNIMCHNCTYTTMKGADYCFYCKRNLQIEGKLQWDSANDAK